MCPEITQKSSLPLYQPSGSPAAPSRQNEGADSAAPADLVELGGKPSPGRAFKADMNLFAADATAADSALPEAALEASSPSTIAKVAAGAMLGLSIFATVASAMPPGSTVQGPPAGEKAPIEKVLDGAEGITAESPEGTAGEQGAAPAGQSFPRTLNLEGIEEPGTAESRKVSEGEENMLKAGVVQYQNIELHNGLRIDLFRATHTVEKETGAAGETGEKTPAPAPVVRETVKKELSPFGVDLGDGLFYDLNGNLTFNPLRVKEEYRTITVDPHGLGNSTTVTKKGDTITIDPFGPFNSTTVSLRKGGIVVDPAGLFNSTSIEQHKGITTIHHPGIEGIVLNTTVSQSGGQIRYDPPGGFNSFTVAERGNETRIGIPGMMNDVVISKGGTTTRIEYPGIADDTVITRSGDRTVINPSGLMDSISVVREGSRITVDPSGLGNSVTITVSR
ncbi:MAG: hypothetical protein RDV48_21255 [Candidatus Eremiobacteraeota bacterium]|nr:hypothetical protein [Candidatus Eremiobacteraeota bacterium]